MKENNSIKREFGTNVQVINRDAEKIIKLLQMLQTFKNECSAFIDDTYLGDIKDSIGEIATTLAIVSGELFVKKYYE